jgi:cytochrome P450
MLQALTTLQDVQGMYDWFTSMRSTQPVWLDEKSNCWHVFRYEEVVRVTTDFTVFSSEQRVPPLQGYDEDATQVPSLVTMDPPHHRQYRQLISSAFSARALAPLSEWIRTITQDLLARVQPTGHMDLIADLASPLATTIIAGILGLPAADHPRFKHWADALFAQGASDEALFNAQGQGRAGDFPSANRALEEMQTYFEHLLVTRRLQPRKDLLSALLAASVEGKPLSQEAIVNFCTLLLLAGHGTTTALLGQAILCLDAHPTALRQLRAHPRLFLGAIEEVLRFASPVWRIMRVTHSAVALAGVALPADAIIFAWLASANRDETQFPHPESFHLRRHPNHHVAFGHGIHSCLGAPLARLQASVALPLILSRLPDLRVVRDPPLAVLASHILFGVKSLPVTFTAPPSAP